MYEAWEEPEGDQHNNLPAATLVEYGSTLRRTDQFGPSLPRVSAVQQKLLAVSPSDEKRWEARGQLRVFVHLKENLKGHLPDAYTRCEEEEGMPALVAETVPKSCKVDGRRVCVFPADDHRNTALTCFRLSRLSPFPPFASCPPRTLCFRLQYEKRDVS